MSANQEHMRILEKIERGEITADEGARQLAALANEQAQLRAEPAASRSDPLEEDASGHEPPDPDIEKWRRWWQLPMWVGVGIMLTGGLIMYWALQAGAGFWFACAWLPFLLGVAVTALAWHSRTGPWMHVRIQQKSGERPARIAISFPLPIRFSVWVLRNFGHKEWARINFQLSLGKRDLKWGVNPANLHKDLGSEHTGLDELIMALEDTITSQSPIYVDVMDDEGGERVQVYIG